MTEKKFALSVRVLLFDEKGGILLLQRSNNSKTNPGKWELPGGKIDPGESFNDALYREAKEETGFNIILHHSAGTAEQQIEDVHVIHLIMVGSIRSGGLSISSEHQEYRWTPIPEIKNLPLADWFSLYFGMYLAGAGDK